MTNEQLYLFLKSYIQQLIDVLDDMYNLMPEDAPREMSKRFDLVKIEVVLEPEDFEALKPLQELIAKLEDEAQVLIGK